MTVTESIARRVVPIVPIRKNISVNPGFALGPETHDPPNQATSTAPRRTV